MPSAWTTIAYDPNAIMYPTLSSANPFISFQDTVMLRALTGLPQHQRLRMPRPDSVLNKLLPAGAASPVPG